MDTIHAMFITRVINIYKLSHTDSGIKAKNEGYLEAANLSEMCSL